MSLILLTKLLKFQLLGICLLVISSPALTADIQIEGLDKKQHTIHEYIGKGKWTVLNIWGADCPPCREEMPDLVQFHDSHNKTDAIVVGIAIDFPSYEYANRNEVEKFVDDYFVDFPVLLSDASITQQLGLGRLEGLPTTYMYTPEGKLVGMQVGGINRSILENFMKKHKKK